MNRYSRVQLIIEDPSLSDLEVSGYFRPDNTEIFLRLLEQGLGVKSELRADGIALRRAD